MKRLSIAIAAAVGVSIAAPLSVSAADKAAKPAPRSKWPRCRAIN